MSFTLDLIETAPLSLVQQRIREIGYTNNPPQPYRSQGDLTDRLVLIQLVTNGKLLNPADVPYVLRSTEFNPLYLMSPLELLQLARQKLGPVNWTSRTNLIKRIMDLTSASTPASTFPTAGAEAGVAVARKKILVVGGGPVGLLFAILIQRNEILNVLYEVTVLERRSEYTRLQAILINADTYQLLPDEVKQELWLNRDHPGCFVLPPSKDNLARCYREKLPLSSAPASFIENSLLRYAQKIGVKIIRAARAEPFNVILTPNEVRVNGQPVEFDIVVGADGTGSKVRSDMLGSDIVEMFRPWWGLTVVDSLDPNQMGGIYDRASPSRIADVMKRPEQHQYRVFRTTTGLLYIGLILTEPEYQQVLQSLQNRTPLPHWLYQQVQNTCKIVRINRCIIPTAENISVFPIRPTFSRIFSRTSPKPVYLIGDALVNTHFFTGAGLNVGVNSAKILAQLLAENPDGRIPDQVYRNAQKGNVKTIVDRIAVITGQAAGGHDIEEIV